MPIAVSADYLGPVGLRYWAQGNPEILSEPEIVSDRDQVLTLFRHVLDVVLMVLIKCCDRV